MTLNLEFELETPSSNTNPDTPKTLSLASGFETQNTIGGHTQGTTAPITKNEKVNAAVKENEIGDSSDEDENPFIAAEGALLKKL